MNEDFNLVAIAGLEKGDLELFADSPLPKTLPVQNAFIIALAYERAKIRRSNAEQTIEYRAMDPEGKLVSAILQDGRRLESDTKVPGALSPEEINQYRDPAQRRLQEQFIAGMKKPAPAKREEKREIPEGIIDLQAFREARKPKKPEYNVVDMMLGGTRTPGYVDEEAIMAFMLQLEKSARDIALEKVEAKIRTALKIMEHGGDMFSGDRDAIERATCFVLTEEVLMHDRQSTDPGQRPVVDNRAIVFGEQLLEVAEQIARFEQDPGFVHSPECLPETKVIALLKTYQMLANELRYKSGIAGKTTAERTELIALCNRLAKTAANETGLWVDIGREALRVKAMIQDDLFTPPELKRA